MHILIQRALKLGAGMILLAALNSACANQEPRSGKPHHTADGFTNPQLTAQTGFLDFLQWRWSRLFKDIPQAGAYDFPVVIADRDYLQQNRTDTTLTWIGHATVLLQLNGVNVLTDPHFSERASPLSWAGPQRVVAPGIAMEDLPRIDYVVISHDHYDSLDTDSIRRLFQRPGGEQTVFLVPLKLKSWFNDLGVTRVVELDWWQSREEQRLRFTAVPSQHWSKRSPFSRNTTLWAGWVITAPAFNFFFCGDSGYHAPMFREIGERLGPFDLAAIPIGAYEPRWFMRSKHLNPDEAVHVHQDVKAARSMAIHWGTFILTDEPLIEPPIKLQEALQRERLGADDFAVFKHGETRRY